VGSRWDYGDRTRGLSFEETNFRSALDGMGHEVHAYDFVARHAELGRDGMNAELERFVRDLEPDIAVFILFKDEIRPETIRRLTDSGVCTFNWFCDDHWRFDGFSRFYAPEFSLVSTTYPEAIPRYHSIGYERVVLSQWACNRYAYNRRADELEYDVTFVGQSYGNRPKIVRALRSSGVEVRCWGYGWEQGRLDHDNMVRTFGASRVNLNLANSWGGRWWWRHPVVSQIKARVFEVPGSGGFLLTESVPHLEDYFDLDGELATFSGIGELVEKVQFWLSNEARRAEAADAGYRRVHDEHTYDRRFEEIFAAAGLPDR
jgi:spore maturation protein CgeB